MFDMVHFHIVIIVSKIKTISPGKGKMTDRKYNIYVCHILQYVGSPDGEETWATAKHSYFPLKFDMLGFLP